MQPRQARPSLIRAASSLPDIVLVIATALNKEGICAVLTGDAAAAMHTGGSFMGRRLTYSLTPPVSRSRLASATRHLGFEPEGAASYRHHDIGIALDLTEAPLAIGRGGTVVPQTLQLRHGFVRILSPTDCCHEQLLRWHATGAAAGMQDAVALAKRCDINMADMRAWMRKEGVHGAWPDFKRAVEGTSRDFAPSAQAARASRPR